MGLQGGDYRNNAALIKCKPKPKLVEEVHETAAKVAPDDAQNKSSMATMGPPQIPPRISRKLTSPVWIHFEKVTVNGEEKAKCVYCSRYYSAKGKNGTSHLKDHIELRCSRKHSEHVDLRQKLLSINRKQNSTSQLENHVFSQEAS
ncbi:uncharacterized protein LOC120185717 [Hibiscus syriacus]|uniref:uncharacterized protein LOC120185717 n=1 Tax=Hibiscus syriacus TaxID=106335 RepID=UPI0019248FFB|nr:uncharacterized protein LOC120185717 [Hibiscus syriacus]